MLYKFHSLMCEAYHFVVNSSHSNILNENPFINISFPITKSVGKKNSLLLSTFLYFFLSKNFPSGIPLFFFINANYFFDIFT